MMIYWWWSALIVKLGLVSYVPLMSDENYYWVWAQNLSLSYFDHPPFVAWLFKLGTFLPEFMLKWPAVLMGHLSLLVWGRFLQNIGFNEQQIRSWFLLSIMAPLVGLSAMVLTPDLPLLLFYSLSIYFFERALNQKRLVYYSLFGISLGLGFTSKYHIVLILPCLVLYLLISGKWRVVQWKYLLMVILFALIGSMPVLLWNYQNDWASFRFQLHHGVGKKAWRPIWPLEYIGSILLMILPFYWQQFYRAIKDYKQQLLIYLCIPIFAFFLFTSFRSKVEANWSQLAFLPTLSLLACYDRSRWKIRTTAIFWTLCLIVLVNYWGRSWYPGCPEKLCEPRRYEAVLKVSETYKPFMASNYQMASYLWFRTKTPVFKLYDMSRTDYFDSFPESKPKVDSFYLVKHVETDLPAWLSNESFKSEVIKNIDEDLLLMRVFK